MRQLIASLFNDINESIDFNPEYSKIYKLHKYWARKPWYVVEKYIQQYSQEGDTVLDPFCGSGCTGLEAIINSRNFIGYDLNPTAVAVSEGTLKNNVNIEQLLNEFQQIKTTCSEKINSLYETEEKCSVCGQKRIFKYILNGPKFQESGLKGRVYCRGCNSRGITRELTDNELKNIKELEEKGINYWYPRVPFPKKFYKDRFSYKGIHEVADMFTKRNLLCLAILLKYIKALNSKNEQLLMLAFTNTVLHVSKLKGENVRPLSVNNYWVPDDYIEENVWFRFEDRFNNLVKSKSALIARQRTKGKTGTYNIQNQSALELNLDEQVDYIFTDPPYGDAIQYSELSFVWNAWMGKSFEIEEEVIINPIQNKGTKEFDELLRKSLGEIYRVLKDNGYFTLCFQNKDFKIWDNVINSCKQLGFVLERVNIYDTFGNPYNKYWAKFSPKADIYVTFKKSSEVDKKRYFTNSFTLETVISEVLSFLVESEPTQEVDVIKLYDITVSLLIWNLYYNSQKFEFKKFDTKVFAKIVDSLVKEKNLNLQVKYA